MTWSTWRGYFTGHTIFCLHRKQLSLAVYKVTRVPFEQTIRSFQNQVQQTSYCSNVYCTQP